MQAFNEDTTNKSKGRSQCFALCRETARAVNACWSKAASIVMQKTGPVPARPDEVAENGTRGETLSST